MADKESPTLDSVLEKALTECGPSSARDAVVIAIHSNFLSAGYECIGIGDKDVKKAAAEVPVSSASSPGLPQEWNQSQEAYSLQYVHRPSQSVCYVKAIALEGSLLISATVGESADRVFYLTLAVSSYVKETSNYSSPTIYVHLLQLMSLISRELETKLSYVCEGMGSHSTTGATGSDRQGPSSEERPAPSTGTSCPTPLSKSDPVLTSGPENYPGNLRDPRHGEPSLLIDRGPYGYGDRDRLPPMGGGDFGMGGGGMIFDPLRQGGSQGRYGPRGPFPPGHPPGARFDPVSPFGLPRPRPPGRNPHSYGPDPDHLPPPGYDDMFS